MSIFKNVETLHCLQVREEERSADFSAFVFPKHFAESFKVKARPSPLSPSLPSLLPSLTFFFFFVLKTVFCCALGIIFLFEERE